MRLKHWILAIIVIYLLYRFIEPLSKGKSPINLGIDLAGGVIVSYAPDFNSRLQQFQGKTNREILDLCKQTLSNRLASKLKTVPDIFVRGDDHLVVTIPAVDNYQQVLALVGETYHLDMRLVLEESGMPLPGEDVFSYRGLYFKLDKPRFSGEMLDERRIKADAGNPSAEDPDMRSAYITFGFLPPYNAQFSAFTRQHMGKRLAILLDNNIEHVGVMQSEITDTAVLTGHFTPDEARDAALLLKSGTLPISLKMVALSTVGPSLGEEVRARGEKALLLSLLLLVLLLFTAYFHRTWFLVAGSLSLFCLLGLLLLLAATFQFTLDTAGIAGLVLSVAMGLDAFIIVFESLEPRLNTFTSEELSRFGEVVAAKTYSFRQQGAVLLHPNIVIILIVLLLLQSDRLQSFAQFMCLGICASVITIFATRQLLFHLSAMARQRRPDPIRWIRSFRPGLFRLRRQYLTAFALLCLAYLLVFARSSPNLGIHLGSDFQPGAQILCAATNEQLVQAGLKAAQAKHPASEIRYQTLNAGQQTDSRYLVTVAIPAASQSLRKNDVEFSPLPSFGEDGKDTRTASPRPPVPTGKTIPVIQSAAAPDIVGIIKIFQANGLAILTVNSIDSKVSAERLSNSLVLLPISFVILLFYFVAVEPFISSWLSKVFTPLAINPLGRAQVAIGVVLSAMHDIVVMLFVCAAFKISLSLSVIAAMLTIIGYSVMDSVVIWNYVRARAEKTILRHQPVDAVAVVSAGIDATFSRVVLTNVCTLLPAAAILVANIEPLRDFAILIAVGTISGSLSSVFVVGPFAVMALSNTSRATSTAE